MAAQLLKQRPQPLFVVGQRSVVEPFTGLVERDRVMVALAHIEPAVHVVIRRRSTFASRSRRWSRSSTGSRQPRYEETYPKAALSLSAVHRCHRDRRQHPPDHPHDRGDESYRSR